MVATLLAGEVIPDEGGSDISRSMNPVVVEGLGAALTTVVDLPTGELAVAPLAVPRLNKEECPGRQCYRISV